MVPYGEDTDDTVGTTPKAGLIAMSSTSTSDPMRYAPSVRLLQHLSLMADTGNVHVRNVVFASSHHLEHSFVSSGTSSGTTMTDSHVSNMSCEPNL